MSKTTHSPQKAVSFRHIAAFIEMRSHRTSRLFSYAGLGVGVLLLLCSVQMFLNINQLLKDKNPRRNGFDFISVTKTISNETMGRDNRFNMADVEELKKQPFIQDAAPLNSNQFRTKASAGNIIPFSTDLFLESINTDFIDTVPPGFNWQVGQADVPIIFSADYLEMYNVFAPSQNLPQLSGESLGSLNIMIECYGPSGMVAYRGHIVALTDRINSVLVPETFISWANKQFGQSVNAPAARVYIKTTDANNPELLSFLEQKNYHVNKDKTKFGRVKQVLQAVVSGMGLFAVLVIILAMMLFSFYLQLVIARSKDNLQLLLLLGYSPGWLGKTVSRRWIPAYTIIILSALLIASLMQWSFQHFSLNGKDELSPFLHIYLLLLAGLIWGLCLFINARMIRKLLYRLQ